MVTDGILASQLALGLTGSSANGSAQSAERFQQAYSRASTHIDGTTPGENRSLLDPLLAWIRAPLAWRSKRIARRRRRS